MRREKKKRFLQRTMGLSLFIMTLYFVFNAYTGISYAVEIEANQSGITVDQTDLFNITNLYPGQPPSESKQPLKIKNTGSFDLQCNITSELTSGDQRLFNVLKLNILDDHGAAVYSGSLGALSELSLGTIKPRSSKTFDFMLELPVDVDNSYQALSTSFQFTLAATGGSSDDDDDEDTDDDYDRIDGDDRTETAVEVSKEGWPNGAEAAILARDDDFPDALAGVPLSKKIDAPILLTNKEILSPATETELERLKAKTVYILGGPGAVSQGIESYLRNKGLEVIRIGGIDRFETAALIAQKLGYRGRAVVTYGYDFPDTLAISPWAASNSIPILLTQKDQLPAVTQEALSSLLVTETFVIGGSGVVSDQVANMLPVATRYAGANRYLTNLSILENLSGGSFTLCLATGTDFPDALVGSALAAKTNSSIILVDETLSEPQVREFLSKHKQEIKIRYVFGGSGAVSDQVLDIIRSLEE